MATSGVTLPLFLRTAPRRHGAARLTATVKHLATSCDLAVCGVTTADRFDGLDDVLSERIAAGHMEGLDWFTDDRARFSIDPKKLMPSARSVVSVGVPYWSTHKPKPTDVPRGRISRYAWGTDYHELLKTRMRRLHAAIEREIGRTLEARFLVDTARIVDRAAAARAGLGWFGKHACVIVPGHGSWVMLGDLLLDLELDPDQPLRRDCGRCSICIDRCPTGAIVAPYTIDTPRCLSFQTIEQRGAIPRQLRPLLGDWVFGCDVCQEVCPYTGAANAADDPDFRPPTIERSYPELAWLLSVDDNGFRSVYRGSAVLRAKRRGLARNAAVALGNVGTEDDIATLARAMNAHDEPLVRGHAAWALGRIGGPTARTALERAMRGEPTQDVRLEIIAAREEAAP